jgi:hypothetical protein
MWRFNLLKSTYLTVAILIVVAGCAPLKVPKPNLWPFNSEDQPGTPVRVVAVWSDTVLYQPNQTPMRGFGGRLLFYAEEKPEPIKVSGTLTVYVFDETNRDPNNVRPDRKYVFTKEQLPSHYSKSKLGHSYSVWIPWDEVGGEQKEIGMIVRFTPEKGSVVVSEQTKHILPGKIQIVADKNPDSDLSSAATPAAPKITASGPGGMVQAASYITPLPPVAPQRQGFQSSGVNRQIQMNTTTIPLPPQSSLKHSLLIGGISSPSINSTEAAQPVRQNYAAPGSGGAKTPTSDGQDNRCACSGESAAINTVVTPWTSVVNRGHRYIRPPNRFGSYQPLVPGSPVVQPTRERGSWQPPPSAPEYCPETLPAQAIAPEAASQSASGGSIVY